MIYRVEGTPTENVGDLQRLMVAERIGRSMQVRVIRQGTLVELELMPRELEGPLRGRQRLAYDQRADDPF